MPQAAFLALLLLCLSTVQATDWYVSATDGAASDTGSGGSDQPFRTVQRAADAAQPGDTVWIRDGVYRETVIAPRSGTSTAPIVFRAAAGAAPVISGADPVGGWTQQNGRWRASLPSTWYDSAINQTLQVFRDGTMVHQARWPNTAGAPSSPGVSRITAFISKSSSGNWTTAVFEDAFLPGVPEGTYVGAQVQIQPNAAGWGWTLTGTVTAHVGKRLTIRSPNDCGVDGDASRYDVGARYVVFDKAELIDADGEWWHDRSAGVLWMQSSTAPGSRVTAKRRDWGFVLDDRAYITLQDLRFEACAVTSDRMAGGDSIPYNSDGSVRYPWRGGDWVATAHHLIIRDVEVLYASHMTDLSGHFFLQWGQNTGVVMSGTDHLVDNLRVRYSAGNGLTLAGHRHRVVNSTFEDCAYAPVDNAAIQIAPNLPSTDAEIANCTIRRTARSGMVIRQLRNSGGSTSVRIHHNLIEDWALQDWDCGAFYVFGNDGRMARIDHNLFRCTGAREGMVYGAYWDYSKNYIFDHNVVFDVPIPIQSTGDNGGVNNLVIVRNSAITSNAAWGRPIQLNNGGGCVVRDNIFKVCTFATTDGNPENHWPGYGSATVASNLVFGDQAGAYWTKERSFNANDHYTTDPGLVDLTARNLRLASWSPARDAGTLPGSISRDGISVVVPEDRLVGAPDLGAYEYGGDDWTAGVANQQGNTPPTITTIANRSLAVGASTGSISFTVGDAQSAAGTLAVTVASSDAAVVPMAAITLVGSGADRTISVTPAMPGSSTITLSVSDGQSQTSVSWVVTGTIAALPTPWSTLNIGSASGGSAGTDGSAFVVCGYGADIWDTADAGRLVYRTLTGDFRITARVNSLTAANAWAKAGIVIRDGTAADARNAYALCTRDYGVHYQQRSVAGAATTGMAGSATAAPRWLRLQRSGGRIIASESSNGSAWDVVSDVAGFLPDAVVVGLQVTGHDTTQAVTARFSSVTVEQLNQPTTWTSTVIGTGTAGSTTISGTTVTLAGSGADIWGTSDALRFASQALTGDGDIVVQVVSFTGANPWAKAGVMMRDSMSANATHAFACLTLGNGVAFQRRTSVGGASDHTAGSTASAPRWLRLSRRGNVFIAAESGNNGTWTTVGQATIAMGATIQVGLAVTSHVDGQLATAVFDQFVIMPAGNG